MDNKEVRRHLNPIIVAVGKYLLDREYNPDTLKALEKDIADIIADLRSSWGVYGVVTLPPSAKGFYKG